MHRRLIQMGVVIALAASVAAPPAEATTPPASAPPALRAVLVRDGLHYLGGGPVPDRPNLATYFAIKGTRGRIALFMSSPQEATRSAVAMRLNTAFRQDFAQTLRPLSGGHAVRITAMHAWKRYLLLDFSWHE